MAQELRQSTPIKVMAGPAVAIADGVTPVAFSSAGVLDEVALYKADASTFSALTGALVGISSGGMIRADLVSADVDTLGTLKLQLRDDSGFLQIWENFSVVSQNFWDAKYGTGNVNAVVRDYASAGVTPNIGAVAVASYSSSGSTPLQPTTAGRTLDVTAGGEAGIDWANIGSPTTTVNLSGTTVKTATDVETDTADIQSRLPAALTGASLMKVDLLAVNGNANSAAQLAESSRTVNLGTVDTAVFTPATSTASSQTSFQADVLTMNGSTNIASAADFFIGRSLIFTTGALRGQRSAVLDYELASAQAKFTIDATTSNPADDVEFVVV